MKKFTLLFILVMISIVAQAQKDVTTFLGIPVDGFKSEMKKKLISKGFTSQGESGDDVLVGEFNGANVNLYIATNNNKVYRIMLCDANTQDEANIKIRFNKLVSQFERNKRYTTLDSYTISEDEDISYEMMVNKKTYDAIFYQNPNKELIDTLSLQEEIRNELLSKYTMEQLQSPTEEVTKDIEAITLQKGMDMLSKKPVWFRIIEHYGKFYIAMFYDNEYNHADGEDL